MTVGDGLAVADLGAVAVAGTTAGLLAEVPALVCAAWACAVREPVGWAVWTCAAKEPAKVSSVTLTAAASHTTTATAAIATPGLARMLFQLTSLIACENHVHSARRATRRRYATASSAVEVQRLKTCSRSSGGSGASGSRRENAAGRSAPHP